MKEVHIIKWIPTGRIVAVYFDYDKASNVCNEMNKKRTWKHRLAETMNGMAYSYRVVTKRVVDC